MNEILDKIRQAAEPAQAAAPRAVSREAEAVDTTTSDLINAITTQKKTTQSAIVERSAGLDALQATIQKNRTEIDAAKANQMEIAADPLLSNLKFLFGDDDANRAVQRSRIKNANANITRATQDFQHIQNKTALDISSSQANTAAELATEQAESADLDQEAKRRLARLTTLNDKINDLSDTELERAILNPTDFGLVAGDVPEMKDTLRIRSSADTKATSDRLILEKQKLAAADDLVAKKVEGIRFNDLDILIDNPDALKAAGFQPADVNKLVRRKQVLRLQQLSVLQAEAAIKTGDINNIKLASATIAEGIPEERLQELIEVAEVDPNNMADVETEFGMTAVSLGDLQKRVVSITAAKKKVVEAQSVSIAAASTIIRNKGSVDTAVQTISSLGAGHIDSDVVVDQQRLSDLTRLPSMNKKHADESDAIRKRILDKAEAAIKGLDKDEQPAVREFLKTGKVSGSAAKGAVGRVLTHAPLQDAHFLANPMQNLAIDVANQIQESNVIRPPVKGQPIALPLSQLKLSEAMDQLLARDPGLHKQALAEAHASEKMRGYAIAFRKLAEQQPDIGWEGFLASDGSRLSSEFVQNGVFSTAAIQNKLSAMAISLDEAQATQPVTVNEAVPTDSSELITSSLNSLLLDSEFRKEVDASLSVGSDLNSAIATAVIYGSQRPGQAFYNDLQKVTVLNASHVDAAVSNAALAESRDPLNLRERFGSDSRATARRQEQEYERAAQEVLKRRALGQQEK